MIPASRSANKPGWLVEGTYTDSPDAAKVICTGDRTGYGNVYEVQVGKWEGLPPLE